MRCRSALRRRASIAALGTVVIAGATIAAATAEETVAATTTRSAAASIAGERAVGGWSEPVRRYRVRTARICAAAHTRLDDEVEPGTRAYERAARRVMAATLPRLRAVPPPAALRARFTRLYRLMAQFAAGTEASFTPTESFWIHQVEHERSLYHCTFSLGR